MSYIYIILVSIMVAFSGYGIYQINKLEKENVEVRANLNTALHANSGYKATLEQIQFDYENGLKALSELKQEKTKEVRYVKEITRDKNSSCIDSINAIYARLLHQRNADNNASKTGD
ncbi:MULTISPECIES: hypothetical protein [Campylobacter]|uniref:hypothetical protein n=1 Tax=Campylobacter TaxID=194 RepID=UPI000A339A69|nr:hypothetical protein [Campylobacter sp. P0124]MCR8697142.1 hypothetical protein [Campylobacter sp. RM19073]MEE3704591.1 hypothetical protein [Campylobacter sp. CX2-8023-23]